jgi:hypothetical protein
MKHKVRPSGIDQRPHQGCIADVGIMVLDTCSDVGGCK